MATSGVTSWDNTRDEIIAGALRKLQALAKGQTMDSWDVSSATQALNSLISFLVVKGMPVWKRIELDVPLISGTREYTITDSVSVTDVYLTSLSGGSQYALVQQPNHDYLYLAPGSSGLPSSYSTKQVIQNHIVTVWPKPDTVSATQYKLVVVFQKKFDMMISSGNTIDFPSYWIQPLIYSLATVLAPEYGIPLNDRAALRAESEMFVQEALDYSNEDASLFLHPTERT